MAISLGVIFAEVRIQMGQLLGDGEAVKGVLADVQTSMAEVTGSAAEADSGIGTLAASMDDVAVASGSADTGLGSLATSLGDVAAQADSTAVALQGAGMAAEEAGTKADAAAISFETLGEGAKKMIAPLAIALAALAAIGIGSMVVAGQYQDSMSVVEALTGQTAQTMQQLNTQVLQMSDDMGVGAKTLGDGLYYILSAGTPTKDAMGELKVVTESSAAGFVDAATDANALTTALNSYGQGADQAEHYQDLLLTAVKDGKQTVQDFATSIGKAAVTGHAAGFAFNEVAAAESTMTLQGDSARQASNQLSFLMRALGINTDKTAKAMTKMGLTFDENKFKSADLVGKLQIMMDATKGNKEELLKLAGGAPGFQAAMMLMGDGGTSFRKILDDMANSSGMTAHAFAVHEETMGAKWDHLKTKAENAAIGIGNALAPVADSLEKSLTPAIQHMTDWVGTHGPETRTIFEGLAIAIGVGLVTALALATIGFISANIASAGITVAIGLLAVGAFFLFQKFQQLWNFIAPYLKPALDDVGKTVRDDLLPAFGRLKDSFGPLLDQLKNAGPIIMGVVVVALFAMVIALESLVVGLVSVVDHLILWAHAAAWSAKIAKDALTGNMKQMGLDLISMQVQYNTDSAKITKDWADGLTAVHKTEMDALLGVTQLANKQQTDANKKKNEVIASQNIAATQAEIDRDTKKRNALLALAQKTDDETEKANLFAQAKLLGDQIDADNASIGKAKDTATKKVAVVKDTALQVNKLNKQQGDDQDAINKKASANTIAILTKQKNDSIAIASDQATQMGYWGKHAGDNFANGLASSTDHVLAAASGIADSVHRVLAHTKPREGPLSEGEDVWGRHIGENLIMGLEQIHPAIKSTIGEIAQSFTVLNGGGNLALGVAGASGAGGLGGRHFHGDINLTIEVAAEAGDNTDPQAAGEQFGRGLALQLAAVLDQRGHN